MPDFVDSMFYVGETPWHGKGIPLQEPPTIYEALTQANLDWDVFKCPTYFKIGLHGEDQIATDHYVTVRATENGIVPIGNVGQRYEVLQNKDAFIPFEPMLDWGFTLETAGSIGNGKKVWILAKSPDRYTVGDDAMQHYVFLYTSHDGSSGNCIRDTMVRVVCQNTLNLALGKNDSTFDYSLRHTVSIKDKILELRDKIAENKGNIVVAVGKMNKMVDYPFNEEQASKYFEHVIPFLAGRGVKTDNELGIRRRDVATPVYDQLMTNFVTGQGNKGESLWDAYNAVTEYYDHQKVYKDWVQATQFGRASDYKTRAFRIAKQLVDNQPVINAIA